jgi:hypothetical protein
VAEAVKSVTAVITGIGAAAKVVDYLAKRIKRSPQKRIVVTVGSTRVVGTGDDDPKELRAALRAALKLV